MAFSLPSNRTATAVAIALALALTAGILQGCGGGGGGGPSPSPAPTPPAPAPTGRHNVLYLIFDDLRPDLPFYGQSFMSTPHLQKLADTGTVFTRAYANIAVCSPSRMSFTTGRRPSSTKTWNFLNHFRQASFESCKTTNRVLWRGTPLNGSGWNLPKVENSGGAGQCCTDCTVLGSKCKGWNYANATCTLFSNVTFQVSCTLETAGFQPDQLHACVSGTGSEAMPTWTTLPASFKKHGYNVLGVGKYFHDGGFGLGAGNTSSFPAGPGTPPLADPPSWTDTPLQFPPSLDPFLNAHGGFKNAYGADGGTYLSADDDFCGQETKGANTVFCPEGAPETGNVSGTNVTNTFCDYITYNHAITQLRWAARERTRTGTPFFQVVGIRRPHLNWRMPESYVGLYPTANVSLPVQPTLDRSISQVEWVSFLPLGAVDPFNRTNTDEDVRVFRQHYYAAASWADYAVGQVLQELTALGLDDSTLVVMHSDHGWHLGEYNMWEKRSLFENAVRVPLVIRAPWIPASKGARASGIVELVDLYRTVHDLLNLSLPSGDTYPVDGTSLKPILEDPAHAKVKDVALAEYPRCPYSNGDNYYDSKCIHFVERTDFTFMGYSMRTEKYRYTEYVAWDGEKLKPNWTAVHSVSLYNHTLDDGGARAFDDFENVNLAKNVSPEVLKEFSDKLHQLFDAPGPSTLEDQHTVVI